MRLRLRSRWAFRLTKIAALVAIAGVSFAQTPAEYLRFFRHVAAHPDQFDPSIVLREYDRCEMAFGNAPVLAEILFLRARYLTRLGRCHEAWISVAKAKAVFRLSPEKADSMRQVCSGLADSTRHKFERLFRLDTHSMSEPARARQFVLTLLGVGLVEAEEAVRREVEWYLNWFPQPAGADSVRAAWGDFLRRTGRYREALSEYRTVLAMFPESLLIPSLAPKAFALARKLRQDSTAAQVVRLVERSLQTRTFSDSTIGAILSSLGLMYLELGDLGPERIAVLEKALDEYRDYPFPADLLWRCSAFFEARGDTERAILCLRLFTVRFPEDPRWSEAEQRLRSLELAYWAGQAEALRPYVTLRTRTERFRSPLAPAEIAAIKRALLEQINRDRSRHGLPAVRFDSLASAVADRHCLEALVNGYSGHFSLNGLKPHHRYALAGGYHALTENFSSATWTGFRATPERVLDMILKSHRRMLEEKPPRDGHRRNILAPQHNACGIGLAVGPRGFRFAEEFLDVYVRFDHVPRTFLTVEEARSETLWVSGRAVNDAEIATASLDFEPWPEAMTPEEISRRPYYELPGFYTSLHRLVEQRVENGKVTARTWWYWAPWSDFRFNFTDDRVRFKVPVVFHKGGPGIYTLSIWVRKEGVSGRFPATYLCFFVR